MAAERILDTYVTAWNEPEESTRRMLLGRCWAEGGTYSYPTGATEGVEALSAHIGDIHEQFPKSRMVRTSRIEPFDCYLRFTWALRGVDDAATLEGIDFARISNGGQILNVVGFYGPARSRALVPVRRCLDFRDK